MLPKLEKIVSTDLSSLSVKREISDYMDYPWHYHPEYEIIYVEKSYGVRLMGSHIGNFKEGDLMFISPNLPHVWRNDRDFYKNNRSLFVDVYVIHFREDSLGKGFFNLPEFVSIKNLFELGNRGMMISNNSQNHNQLSILIKKVYSSKGIDRIIEFLNTLKMLAQTKEYELLSSPGYTEPINSLARDRINKVINYLMNNYQKDIALEDVAQLVNLNKSSFCRFFKLRVHKTFSQFLNEIRIAHACKLLVNNNMNVSEICYEVGYNNISHFNRQFKLIHGVTAKEYTRRYMDSFLLESAV